MSTKSNDESPNAIRILALDCEALFHKITEDWSLGVLANLFEDYEQRFLTWTAYAGVFARPTQCLDERLKNTPDIQDLILRGLDSLGRSLTFVATYRDRFSIDDNDEPSGDWESKQGHLFEIEETLEQLGRLTNVIRESTRTSFDQKARKFAGKGNFQPVNDLFGLIIRDLYPHIQMALRDLLTASMFDRFARISLLNTRKDTLSTRYDKTSTLSVIDENLPHNEPMKDSAAKNRSHDSSYHGPPGRSTVTLSSINTKALMRNLDKPQRPASRTDRTPSILVDQHDYPKAPGENTLCDWCAKPVKKRDVESSQWRRHVDNDLKPYICLVENCTLTTDYASFREWSNHMQRHDDYWYRTIYPALTWTCPLCAGGKSFGDNIELLQHMAKSHHTSGFQRDQLEIIAQQSQGNRYRSENECLLCGLFVDVNDGMMSVHSREEQQSLDGMGIRMQPNSDTDHRDSMSRHIASHLRTLMLITIRIVLMHRDPITGDENDSVGGDAGEASMTDYQHLVGGFDAPAFHHDDEEIDCPTGVSKDVVVPTSSLELFREYVATNLLPGVNGQDKKVSYIPASHLEAYWTKEHVDGILRLYDPPMPLDADMIISRYLRIFSILVYIRAPPEISWFSSNIKPLDDSGLPFDRRDFPHHCSWADLFFHEQWKFNPFILSESVSKSTVPYRTILPAIYREKLTEKHGDQQAVTLWKVQLHPLCNLIAPESTMVVFKIFEGSRAEAFYTAEADSYLKLRSRAHKYITSQFAWLSFRGLQKSIIVMEYAAADSLSTFLQSAPLPIEQDDYLLLWGRLLKLLDALEVLHDLYARGILSREHQDIQPDNILVFPQQGKSSFDVIFKLTFPPPKVRSVSSLGGTTLAESRNDGTYVDAEVYANLCIPGSAKAKSPHTADIWSLGAIFSDVLIWSIHGELGRAEYSAKRMEEMSKELYMKPAIPAACFHDGEDRLLAVEKFHNLAHQHRRPSDSISPIISRIILDCMLTSADRRLTAREIKSRAERCISEVQKSPPTAFSPSPLLNKAPQELAQETTLNPGSIREANSMSISPMSDRLRQQLRLSKNSISDPASTMVTVGMVYAMLEEKDDSNPLMNPLNTRAERAFTILTLPGLMEARSKVKETMGRDQIMVIDNFSSMERHRQSVMRTARVVSYIAKVADDSVMKVYAASEATEKPRLCITSSDIEKEIGKMETVTGTCNMWKSLDLILDRILVGARVKPTSICIYTDGVWEAGAGEVERAIRRAIDYLIKCNQSSSTLMFQFIQFGDDAEGSSRLAYLDDECTRQHGSETYDIVDTRRCGDNIREIVIGSISKYHDGKRFKDG